MPAVTVPDTLVPPRVTAPTPGEPVDAHGAFVMHTRAEILGDFEAGKLGKVPADHIGNA